MAILSYIQYTTNDEPLEPLDALGAPPVVTR